MIKTFCITFGAMLLSAIFWHIATPAHPPPIFLLGGLHSLQIPFNRTLLDISGIGFFGAVLGLMTFEPQSVKLLDPKSWFKWMCAGLLCSPIPVFLTGLLTLPLMILPLSIVLTIGWNYERTEISATRPGKFEAYFRNVTISIFGCGFVCGIMYGYLTGFLIALFLTIVHELVGGAIRTLSLDAEEMEYED